MSSEFLCAGGCGKSITVSMLLVHLYDSLTWYCQDCALERGYTDYESSQHGGVMFTQYKDSSSNTIGA